MKKQQFLVVGLGSFGETIAAELTRLGHDVVGIDTNAHLVDRLADVITHAVVADGADDKALEELNAGGFDAAVVAIGEHIEASLLATLHLRSLGVKEVWVKALTRDHHRILAKIGATRIVHPEYEMGMRVAQALNHPTVNNYISLGDEEYIVEMIVTEKIEGRKVEEILEEAGADVKLLMVRRKGRTYVTPVQLVLAQHDHLVLVGQLAELRKTAPFV